MMKILAIFLVGTLGYAYCSEPTGVARVDGLLSVRGNLIFQDDFQREESDDAKEELGKKWVTNSKKRAKGVKQADLTGDSVIIKMAKVADHGVSMRHDAPFDDGVVQVRFRMFDAKGIGFNFNDPKCKVSHAGHICHLGVKPNRVTFRDGKTGVFDLKIRANKLAGASKTEMAKLLEGKLTHAKVDLQLEKWHVATLLIQGDTMTAWLNGKLIGSIQSSGIDHEVKQNLAFAVSGRAEVDDVKIWSLDVKK
jgi:hypothetical protein